MLRTVRWTSAQEPGAEYVAVWQTPQGYRVQGDWVGTAQGQPARARYRLALDLTWGVKHLRAAWETGTTTCRVRVQRNATGIWQVNGEQRPDLTACVDLDLAWSPLTNTLPIRRLGLAVGAQRELCVAYIEPPLLTVVPDRQRYTRLGPESWRYESLDSGFSADLTVDEDGLVVDYPPLFRRVAQWNARD
jgi:hypothetical protein